MQSIIIINRLSFELSNGRNLFNHISFSLGRNLTALVGPNGIGKTCLAKLIAGELSPTTGTIYKNTEVTFFPQRETPKGITVEDYLGNNYAWSTLGEKLLSRIDRTALCTNLSGGQWMRVRLAKTIDTQFLILDEPSNDLDHEARTQLINFLTEYQHGILLISHDREFLKLCNEVLELSNQGLQKYGMNWLLYESQKQLEVENSLQELNKSKRERDKVITKRNILLSRQVKRNHQGNKAAKKGGMPKILVGARKRQAQSTIGKIDASTMEKANERAKDAYEAYSIIKVDPIMYMGLIGHSIPNQKLVAEAKDFNVLFNKWLFSRDLNFSWRGNIRVAIKGANGAGKTTLVKGLLGQKYKTKGSICIGKLKTLYLDQQCANLNDALSIIENVRRNSQWSESDIRNGLAKLLFTGESVNQEVHTLSGGERLRAALACSLLTEEKPELIILDEPTNNLDLANIKFLENLISQYKGAIIIISHDDVFLNECGINDQLMI